MKATEFIKQLKLLSPSKEDLQKIGFSQDDIRQTLEGYNPIGKRGNLTVLNNDPINELIENYDLSKVEIGLVTFNSEIKKNSDYDFFGLVESDLLVINEKNKRVQVLERGTKNHLLWECAKDGDAFLDALIIGEKFLIKCLFDDDLWNNKQKISDAVTKASSAAGGEEFTDFYKMLLGYY